MAEKKNKRLLRYCSMVTEKIIHHYHLSLVVPRDTVPVFNTTVRRYTTVLLSPLSKEYRALI